MYGVMGIGIIMVKTSLKYMPMIILTVDYGLVHSVSNVPPRARVFSQTSTRDSKSQSFSLPSIMVMKRRAHGVAQIL